VLILIGPNGPKMLFQAGKPLFPLQNPGIVSVPLGFVGAWLGTMLGKREANAEAKFTELEVRANLGLGAEQAASGAD
jgi:cation/acetate symporter